MPKPTERTTKSTERTTKPTGGTLEVFTTIRNSLTPNATVTVGKKDTKKGWTTTIVIAVSVSFVAVILAPTFFYFICYRKQKRYIFLIEGVHSYILQLQFCQLPGYHSCETDCT